MKSLILLLTSALALNAAAATDLSSEMSALGANKELMKKAKAIDPNNRIRVVQNREVDRTWRLELGLNYGTAAGGDPYVDTNLLGGTLDLHITPRFSVGARYYNANNSLSAEGKNVFRKNEEQFAAGDKSIRQPGLDYAKDMWMAIASVYPIYGKMNLFDKSVAQFDLYLLGGAGSVQLGSGSAPIYTAGGGVGMWLTQHFSSRLEARWQGYQDAPDNGGVRVKRSIDQTILTATVGFML